MSTPTRSRKSRLAGAMAAKAVIEEPEKTEASPPTLSVAPDPVEPAAPVDQAPEAPENTPDAAPVEPMASTPTLDPDQVEPEVVPSADPGPIETPEVEPATQPQPRSVAPAAGEPLQKAQVLAGTGQIDLGPELKHLRAVVETGRDQRRYVENLPRRSEKGTYLRLPVHLQDVLAEYCDRNTAPMGDLVAAVMDSYFRDIGALPPLGEGNRPVEKFFDKMRKQQQQQRRTYD